MNNYIKRLSFQICSITLAVLTTQTVWAEEVNKSIVADGATNISVENLRGTVKISGWDNDEVKVTGEIDEKAERFIFEKDGAYIKVKVVMPRHLNGSWNDRGSNLQIKVPHNIRLYFSGVSTDITINNIDKSAEVKSVSGNITASKLSEHVELSTVSGDINSENLSGKITLVTVSGDIDDNNSQGRIKLKAVSGRLRSTSLANEVFINTVSGGIDVSLDKVDELSISTVSGNVDGELSLNNNGLVKMSSVSGDIDLVFENDVQASFRMKSNAGGDLVNKITDDKVKHAKYGPSSKLYFETGNAKASVKASTVSGSIKVSKK